LSIEGAAAGGGAPKVLFFSHDGKLGDAVVITAFVAGLRAHAPGCEIHATVAGVTATFWARDARLRTLWSLARRGWGVVLKTGLALRRERFDFIVTWRPMRSEKNRLLLWLARPGRVVDLAEFHRAAPAHRIEACREALRQFGVPCDGELAYDVVKARGAGIGAAPASGDAPDFNSNSANADIVLVNLFAADPERTIDATAGVALLAGLRRVAPEAALRLVCHGATAAAARAVLARSDSGASLLDCEGGLERLFDACARASLVVSPDTALIHLASAFDTPVIGIYQNDGIKAREWGPRSRAHAVVLAPGADSVAGFSVEAVLRHALALRARQPACLAPVPSAQPISPR